MGLRHFIPVVLLSVQLYGLTEAVGTLPQLLGNRLSEGAERNLPNASMINCGHTHRVNARTKRTRTLNQALASYFSTYKFTAQIMSSHLAPRITGHESHFNFAEVKGKKYVYALEVDPSGESAYWLKQGGTIDIPAHPNAGQPKYVFTPDFSGCSWTVTPLGNGNLRLRHVQGGHEAVQFNNLSPAQKGGSTTYAMQYKDYGYIVETQRLVESVSSFAYMHYSGGHWTLYFQQQTCSAMLSGSKFQNQLLSSTIMFYYTSSYPAVSYTKVYRIP